MSRYDDNPRLLRVEAEANKVELDQEFWKQAERQMRFPFFAENSWQRISIPVTNWWYENAYGIGMLAALAIPIGAFGVWVWMVTHG